MFHIDDALVSTNRLYFETSSSTSKTISKPTFSLGIKKKNRFITKDVPAIKVGKKLLVIKGYSEDSSVVLNTLEKEDTSLTDIGYSEEPIVPTTVTVEVSDEPGTTVLNQDGDISEYEVVSGDTVESIAKRFNLTPETVLWANDLKKTSPIHVGQKLVILPVSGVSYTIRNGDTLSEISEKFHVSQAELTEFNSIEDGKLMIGDVIIIPGGKITPVNKPNIPTNTDKNTDKKSQKTNTNKGYFSRPVIGGVKTQGIHGHNGIDIAAAYGTPILAAADGYVSLVRGSDAWNGGYGNYVVVTHGNGVQTLYAHMSDIRVNQGQRVSKGQRVGSMGSTGQSTGVHLHFEVRGAKNPF